MDHTTPAADARADADSETPIIRSKDAVNRDTPEAAVRAAEEIASHNDALAAAPAKPPREPDPDPAQAAEDIARQVVVEERGRISGIYDAAKKLSLDTAIADDLVRRGTSLDAAAAC